MQYSKQNLDCVVIGYNELPLAEYEETIREYGEESEAYRDLKFSFLDIDGRKMNYVDLLNHVTHLAQNGEANVAPETYKSGDIPNLAAVYLTNFLKMRGYSAKYINLFQHEKEKLANYLSQNPLCVAITTTFYILNFPVIEMVKFIREHNPDVKIIVGGPLISNHFRRYSPEQLKVALADIGADIYVVESQGEDTLFRIVEALKEKVPLSTIPNIIYNDGSTRINLLQPETNSLDQNFIDWTSFPEEDLGPTLQTRTARSCAFSCSFCGYPARAGALTLSSLETFGKELDSMYRLGNVRNVVFIDDTFNVPLARFKEMCQLMIDKQYGFNWFSYFRCSNSDEEAIELMAKSGCKGVFLGIESGSPTILKNMHKAATVEKYTQGIKLLKEHGILTFGSFIMGFPGETEATIEETIHFIEETELDYYRIQLWYCEPGTPIYNQRDKFQIKGEGFRWEHETMESLEAMDHIERAFLSISRSVWLPQWSFDFWFIPYILGKGVSLTQFKQFMISANQLLATGIAHVSTQQKKRLQEQCLQEMVKVMGTVTTLTPYQL